MGLGGFDSLFKNKMTRVMSEIPTILMIGNHLSTVRWNKNIWHYLAERLRSLGWIIITTSSKEPKFQRLIDMLWTIWSKKKQYSLSQVDVFSGNAFIYAAMCTSLLRFLNKKIVLTLHGGRLPEFSLEHPKWVKRVLNRADIVVTPSPYLQTRLAEFRPDIRLIPNPIDLSVALYRERNKALPILIWVRAFHEVYNPSLAPKVIHLLVSEFPQIHLIMLGPDKGDGSFQHTVEVARDLGVEDRIEWIGGVAHLDVPFWLNKADIFINTTRYDTAPRSLIEAMGNGLCVISTNVGGVPYIIENDHEGLLVPSDDAEAMASAIRRVLTDPALAGCLSLNARAKAESYDWSAVLPQWEELFLNLINA